MAFVATDFAGGRLLGCAFVLALTFGLVIALGAGLASALTGLLALAFAGGVTVFAGFLI